MSYFKEVIDPWLNSLLASMPDAERSEAKQQIKEKLLESYHNGKECRPTGAGRTSTTPS